MCARLLIIAAMLCTAASDVVIAPTAAPSTADLAEVAAQEVQIVNEINQLGAEQTLAKRAGGSLPPDVLSDLRLIDQRCGKIRTAERVSSKRVGSHYVAEEIVAMHERCMIKWELTFTNAQGTWTLLRFNFATPDRGW